MIADPKAVQHVLHKPGYHYDKAAPRAHFNELVVGKGLVSVCGLCSAWIGDWLPLIQQHENIQAKHTSVSGRS
jgi:hypothetical protein